MSLRTHTYHVNGKEINIKAKKDVAKKMMQRITSLTDIRRHRRELTGIKGGDAERSSTYYMPLSPPGTLADETGFERELAHFMAKNLPDPITESDWPEIQARIDDIFNRHVPVDDKRQTPDQQKEQARQSNDAATRRKAERAEKQRKFFEQQQGVIQQYPHLQRHDRSKSDYAVAATNIRTELKKTWPGQEFSVRSKSFSMGDAIDIRWTDGPTRDQVEKLTNKYQRGHFDGMQDMYVDDYWDVWTNTFGGSKYVTAERSLSAAAMKQAAAEAGRPEAVEEDANGAYRLATDRETEKQIRTIAEEKSYYQTPEQASEDNNDPQGEVQVLENPEKNGIEIWFSEKPSPGIRAILKANGFRFHRKRAFWYAKQNTKTWAVAKDIADRYQVEIHKAA